MDVANRVFSMSIEPFRSVLARWLEHLLSQASSEDLNVETKTVWAEDDANRAHVETANLAHFSPKYIYDSADNTELREAASKWSSLDNHIDKMFGRAGGSFIRLNLGMLLYGFVPEPHFNGLTGLVDIPSFDEIRFSRQFERFAAFIESDLLHYEETILVPGLKLPKETLPFTLNDFASIVRLSSGELRFFGEHGLLGSQPLHFAPYPYIGRQMLALSSTWTYPKVVVDDPSSIGRDRQLSAVLEHSKNVARLRESVLGALALTKYGEVALAGGATRLKDWPVGGTSLVTFTDSFNATNMLQPKMELLSSDYQCSECVSRRCIKGTMLVTLSLLP